MNDAETEIIGLPLHTIDGDSFRLKDESTDSSGLKSIAFYCSIYGAFAPPSPAPFYKILWFWFVRFMFFSYTMSVFTFLIYEFATTRYISWILFNLILTVKCAFIAHALYQMVNIMAARDNSHTYSSLCSRAYPQSLYYYRTTIIIGAAVFSVWSVIRYHSFATPFWILFVISILGGTYGFICHMATVTLVCIAETLELQDKLVAMKTLADSHRLLKSDFVDARNLLTAKENGIYRMNQLIIGSVLLNTLVMVVVLFNYRSSTSDESYTFRVWYVVYVACTLFMSDICYLFVVLPIVSRCNDMMIELTREVALSTWDPALEHHRQDVLMAMVALPLRVKFFGMEMTKDEMWRRLLGLAIAVLSIIAKYLQQELHEVQKE
jgi:hypothetical protein